MRSVRRLTIFKNGDVQIKRVKLSWLQNMLANEVSDIKFEHSRAEPAHLAINLISNSAKQKAVGALDEKPRK